MKSCCPLLPENNETPPSYVCTAGSFSEKLLIVVARTQNEPKFDVIAYDPSDEKYLECAVAGRADFIISGDRRLTDSRSFQDIRIISPAHFGSIFTE